MKLRIIIYGLYISFFMTGMANQVIFIMGPSCSGKSTLAKAVLEQLDRDWVLLEYDVVEDVVGRHVDSKDIFIVLIEAINRSLVAQKNVVVDTNTFYNDLCVGLIAQHKCTYVFVYAPLEMLLQRDDQRTKNLFRSDQSAKRARSFVIKNFNTFYPDGIVPREKMVIDTTKYTVMQAVEIIKQYTELAVN